MTPYVRYRADLPRVMLHMQGAALIVSLLMLTATLMLGLSIAQNAVQDEKAARNARDRQVALQAAESALTDAELDIMSSARSHLFASDRSEGFAEGCGRKQAGLYLGLCRRGAEEAPVWRTVDFLSAARSQAVPYGHFTGRRLQTGEGMLPALPPRYMIELMSYADADKAVLGEKPLHFYRITAIGFGVRESTQVMVQTFYRKGDGDSRVTKVPAGRFGWREIENWQELRDAES